jgi:diguanylate cyclase (GGDEF)-like protein
MLMPAARRQTTDTNALHLPSGGRALDRFKLRLSSIAVRLVAVVLVTGTLAFGALGILTSLRFNVALQEQATALGQLSERQLAVRLDGEAKLARARLEGIGAEVSTRLQQIAKRTDIIQAIESGNEVAIREHLHGVTHTAGYDRLIAFNRTGGILASDAYLSLIQLHTLMPKGGLNDGLDAVLAPTNSRANPTTYERILELDASFAEALHLPEQQFFTYVAIAPVFEDFGDLIGAVAAIRTLGRSEATLEKFTTLAEAGVAILKDNAVISGAGPKGVTFSEFKEDDSGLIQSDDGRHVARCVSYATRLQVCTFTDADVAKAWRDQMLRIGAEQTQSAMSQFLLLSALTLGTMVIALLLVVRHTTRGLSTLASAAKAVADGNLQIRIAATGVGEVHMLSRAFIRMLANLRKSMGRIEQLAYNDPVTILPNRAKVLIDAPTLIDTSEAGVVFYIDLDGFKSVNDTYGHRSGDQLLKQVAERLVEYFSALAKDRAIERWIVARLSGDEFIVILADKTSIDGAGEIAQGAIQKLNLPFNIGALQVSVGASVGITSYPADGTDFEIILINADLAMYAAKQNGRNSFARFTVDLSEQAKKRVSLERDLKAAVRDRKLTVHYQPKVECRSGRIRGVEALVRWQHPEQGFISPSAFLPIAEEIGLIGEIDQFVICRAIEEVGALNQGGMDLQLSVNVTAIEIEDAEFLQKIALALGRTEFPPSRLEIEITESDALQNPDVVRRRVANLRRMGVRLAIDDFGAGYSNLATLARLPIDTLKLDRALVAGVGADPDKQSIVRVALGLARELGLDSVAEGVETVDEFNFVVNEGATMVQGYFCSPPVALPDLIALTASDSLVGITLAPNGPNLEKEHRLKRRSA